MSVKYAMLGILAEKNLHGYELKSSFDEKVGEFWSLNYGQIYSTLDRLEKEDLVTHDRQAQDKRPDRKIFSITGKGRTELEEWLSTPVNKVRALRDEFFIKLVFMDREDPGPILELIEKQKALYLKQMNTAHESKGLLEKEAGECRYPYHRAAYGRGTVSRRGGHQVADTMCVEDQGGNGRKKAKYHSR